MARILVLGGTGALGTYLVPALLACGHDVDVVSLDDAVEARAYIHKSVAAFKRDWTSTTEAAALWRMER